MIEAIVFDFYGVIYSNFDWEVIDDRIYGSELNTQKFKELIGQANSGKITNTQLLKRTGKLAGDDSYPDKLAVKTDPSLNYVAIGLIEGIKTRYKTGLLSNGSKRHIAEAFEQVGGVDKFFDVVLTSADTGYAKPKLEAFTSMVGRLDVEPQKTLIIDDSPQHIMGAQLAGLQTIRFNDMEHLRRDLSAVGVE